jgi:hypothetical protein
MNHPIYGRVISFNFLSGEAETLTPSALLERSCAMLTRLAHMGDRHSGLAQIEKRKAVEVE